jgi:hypothetical protein
MTNILCHYPMKFQIWYAPSRTAEAVMSDNRESIIITVTPALNADGSRANSTRGPLFDSTIDGRSIVHRSTTPFCDSARALLAEGVTPSTPISMAAAGADHDALRSTVGAAAKLTTTDATKDGKPRFVKWQPNRFRGVPGVCDEPSVRQIMVAATALPGVEIL